jgi:predicted choloylglycine hydrolase
MGTNYKHKQDNCKLKAGRPTIPEKERRENKSVSLHPNDWNDIKGLAKILKVPYSKIIDCAVKYYYMLTKEKQIKVMTLNDVSIKDIKDKLKGEN